LKAFQAISYSPLANEKYAFIMMSIEDAAKVNKDFIIAPHPSAKVKQENTESN
jgi:hypothetical protein